MRTQITLSGNTVYWKSRKLGTVYPSESTFHSVSRSKENIFHLFGGLGINKELLYLLKELDIKYVEVLFCGETLRTTTNKYLRGIPLPKKYCSDVVDLQLFLRPDQINLDEIDTHKVSSTQEQLSLFGSA